MDKRITKFTLLLFLFIPLVLNFFGAGKLSAQAETSGTNPKQEPVVLEPVPLPPKEEKKEGYVSPQIGNLSGEYLRSLQVTAKQRKAIQENKSLWFADKFRVGFGIRPKVDSLYNTDFDKSTADNRNNALNQTQFFVIGDLNENVLFKVTLQDVRLWGGEIVAGGNADQKYGAIANAGTTVDTSKQKDVVLNNFTGFREAFLDLKTTNQNFRLRTGRQILEFGDGRILGSRNDSLNGNSFDALRFTGKISNHTLDIFGSVVGAENNSNSLVSNNSTKIGGIGDSYFGGVHYNWKVADWLGLDLYNYSLFKQQKKASAPPVLSETRNYRGDDQLNTSGFRLTNRTKNNSLPDVTGMDWMVEAAWQTGFNGERVTPDWFNPKGNYVTNQKTGEPPPFSEAVRYKANIVAVQLGYTPVKEFRIGVQYVQASGDPNRNDSSVATYNPLFATRRMAGGALPFAGNGNSGLVFWQNIKDYSIHLKYETSHYGTFIFNPHWYYKVKLQDGYYDNNNYVAGSKATGETASTEDYFNNQAYNTNKPQLGKLVATELNFIYIITPFENVSFWFGATVIRAGDAIRNQKNNPNEPDPLHRYDLSPTATMVTFQTVFAI